MTYVSTVTNNNITLVLDGQTTSLTSDSALFLPLAAALRRKAPVDEVRKLTSIDGMVSVWSEGKFSVDESGAVCNSDGPIPRPLHDRVMELIRLGKSPKPVFNFWQRLSKNPSYRSVKQLWGFLQHCGIPLTNSGHFLAYKSVRSDLRDHHSGKWENKPGKTLRMDRSKVSDDPAEPCHEGYHVGAESYARSFGNDGSVMLVCRVDPENVVCVPNDSSMRKMRTCEYDVLGFYNGTLDSTLIEDEDMPDNTDITILVEDLAGEEASRTVEVPSMPRELSSRILSMSMDDLRQFARQDLKIVGVNKMSGGKVALLEVVLSNLAMRSAKTAKKK